MDRLLRLSAHLSAPSLSAQPSAASSSSGPLAGQVAVVTGGAQGIGFAVCERLGKDGAAVFVLDLSGAAVDSAVKRLQAAGVNAQGLVADVTSLEQLEKAFARAHQLANRLDILVCSAGITGKTNVKTDEVDPQDYAKVFSVNSTGVFYANRCALRYMKQRNYGRIVNIASVAGKEGNAGMLAYSSSKAAVIGLTKVVGKEFAETGITCNAVAPAVVRTAMVDAMPEQQVKYMTDKIPMKRCGSLAEIADLVAFIASPQASFTTAFTFDATGGRATY